jgi:hypothetical protein
MKLFLPLFMASVATSPALAADIEFELSGPGGLEDFAITFEDPQPGQLPGITALTPEGSELLIHVRFELPEVEEGQTPQVMFDVVIRELSSDKEGRAYLETISHPRIITMVNQQGTIKVGAKRPDAGEGAAEASAEPAGDYLEMNMVYRDEAVE